MYPPPRVRARTRTHTEGIIFLIISVAVFRTVGVMQAMKLKRSKHLLTRTILFLSPAALRWWLRTTVPVLQGYCGYDVLNHSDI